MRSLITLNSSHFVGKGRFRYPFNKTVNFKDATISVHQLSVYNSTYNIKSEYENNKYSIIWIDGNTYNFTIPDGFYTIDDLSARIQFDMTQEKLYMQNNTAIGDDDIYVYFINLQTNDIRYKIEIDISFVPSQTFMNNNNLSYTRPSGATWSLPTNNTTPRLVLSKGLQKLMGFDIQTTFPTTPQSTMQVFLSTITPILQPVDNYVLSCNLVHNDIATIVPNVIYQIPLTVPFGKLITVEGINESRLTIRNGSYSFLEVQFWTQSFDVLDLLDNEVLLSFIIEIKDE